jgi:predicted DNA-binding transcriptional regulator YafY
MRRIERLINLIAALLEADVPMTAEDIRERISGYGNQKHDAFRRAFERDKADLKAMGIPIDVVALDSFGDTPPGYTIPKARYYLPELDLEADELAALRIAAGAVLGVEDEAGSGVLKLSMGAMDEASGGARLAWNADVAASHPSLGPLYSAVAERSPITFDYQPAGTDKPGSRTVKPYALLHRRGHWYLVGHDDRSNETRTFKVARIAGEITRGEGTYEVPQAIDVRDHVVAPGGSEEGDMVVKLRFDPSLRWWPEQNLAGAPAEEGPGGSYDVDMPVPNLDALAAFAVWWGSKVEVLGPPAARRYMKERFTR